jgi:FkbM family methyltransferase
MFTRLESLKKYGFDPVFVLDIGANIGQWNREFSKLFPTSRIKSFEANSSCEKYLQDLDYTICLLGDEDEKVVDFYKTNLNGPTPTGASVFRELHTLYDDSSLTIDKMKMKKLDTLLRDQKIDLMKLDVQGAELLVLNGAQEILKNTDFVLMEVSVMKYNKGSPLISEVINYMANKEFNVFDIVDVKYIHDLCVQCDILFVNSKSKQITHIETELSTRQEGWKPGKIF